MTLKILALGVILVATLPAQAADRAQTLHDTYCVLCHTTQVYTRADRLATDYEGLRAQVNRWQQNVSLNWSEADIDLVAGYLAQRFYKMPCPMC